MITTTPAALGHAHHEWRLPSVRAALSKLAARLGELHYRYVSARIEAELRGSTRLQLRRDWQDGR